MRGVISSVQRLCLVVCLTLLACLPAPFAHATDGLDLARDTIGSFVQDAPNIYHEIYFVLPVDSHQITVTDWILIDMPHYSEVNSTGVFLTGGFGTPSISRVGNQVRISNFTLLPGTGVTINGITATNPPTGQGTQVILTIAEDSAASVIRNQVTLIPTDSRNIVNVSATIQTQLSGINISGYTSANTFTTLIEGQSVLGTTVSDNSGYFVFSINAISPGTHSFRIFATDAASRSTSQTSLNLFLLVNSVTTASGILLSPALSLSTSQIHAGETLTVSGTARPSSQINLFLESPLRSYTANTDTSGNWSYVVPISETIGMTPGQYRVYAVDQDTSGNQSVVSPTATFEVVSAQGADNPPPACSIAHGDLNCNGVTNLTDFSILLFHWNTNHKVADINGDGIVNLVDFSIMMFYYH
jgi:hypothetical protein